jgi:hypothetical protein
LPLAPFGRRGKGPGSATTGFLISAPAAVSPNSLRTPRPQGAKHLRAREWAEWFEQAIFGPAHIQITKDGARDLVIILTKAAVKLAEPAPAALPQLPMSMQTLHVPGRKRSPKFTEEVPPQVRRLIWIKWLQQHLATERPFYPLSSEACAELVELLAAE